VRGGLKVGADAIQMYTDLQSGHRFHWIIFNAQGDEILVEQSLAIEEKFDYDDFVAKLTQSGNPRYAVLDYNYMDGNVQKDKLIFILWSPDSCAVGDRMKYASSKDGFKKKLNGIHKDIEAHDEAEIEESNILQRCLKNYFLTDLWYRFTL